MHSASPNVSRAKKEKAKWEDPLVLTQQDEDFIKSEVDALRKQIAARLALLPPKTASQPGVSVMSQLLEDTQDAQPELAVGSPRSIETPRLRFTRKQAEPVSMD